MYKYMHIRSFYKYIRFLGKCEVFVAFFAILHRFFIRNVYQTAKSANYLFSIFLPFTM